MTSYGISTSKSEHKHAGFVLGDSLANAECEDEVSSASRTGGRMDEFVEEVE